MGVEGQGGQGLERWERGCTCQRRFYPIPEQAIQCHHCRVRPPVPLHSKAFPPPQQQTLYLSKATRSTYFPSPNHCTSTFRDQPALGVSWKWHHATWPHFYTGDRKRRGGWSSCRLCLSPASEEDFPGAVGQSAHPQTSLHRALCPQTNDHSPQVWASAQQPIW